MNTKKDNRPQEELRKLKRGDIRKDGMIFWCYNRSSINGEHWLSEEDFIKYKEAIPKRKDNRPPKEQRTLKRGDKREDGKLFWRYKASAKDGEEWFDKEEFDKRQRRTLEITREMHKRNPSLHMQYMKKRRENPTYVLIHNQRIRVWKALKKLKKIDRTLDLIGCTEIELRNHIESKFTDGMSWDNYGKYGWHVDHIRPCSSFDLSEPEQQRQCFHYTNLQPLWAKDNLSKGSHYNPE